MKYFFLVILFSIVLSCKQDKNISSNSIIIHEFKHVIEIPNKNNDGFKYSYHNSSLDSIETEILKELFSNRAVKYFISDDGRIYYDTEYYMDIGTAFVFSGEIIDTIMSRNLKPSVFAKTRISTIPKNGIPPRWDNAINTWFTNSLR